MNVSFELSKITRFIGTNGAEYIFKRAKLNKFGESEALQEEIPVFGVYRATFNSYVSRQVSDGSVTKRSPSPMILTTWNTYHDLRTDCDYSGAKELKIDDELYINGKRYKINSITNVNELDYAGEISLEVYDGSKSTINSS